jgi:hypothetical protein
VLYELGCLIKQEERPAGAQHQNEQTPGPPSFPEAGECDHRERGE